MLRRRLLLALAALILWLAPVVYAALPQTVNCSTDLFGSSLTVITGTWSVDSGQCRHTGGADGFAKWTADSFTDDHYAQGRLIDQNYPTLCVRMTGTNLGNFDGYCVYRRSTEGNSAILRIDDGVGTQLGANFSAPTDSTVVKIAAVDDVLTLYFDAVSQGTRDGSAYPSGGAAGIGAYSGSYLDDLEFGNVGGGGGPTCTGGLSLLGVGGC